MPTPITYTLPQSITDIKMYDNEILSHISINQHIKKLHNNLYYLYNNPCGFSYPTTSSFGPIQINDYVDNKPSLNIYDTTTALTPWSFLTYMTNVKAENYVAAAGEFTLNFDEMGVFSSFTDSNTTSSDKFFTHEISTSGKFFSYVDVKDLYPTLTTVDTPDELSAVFDFDCFYHSSDSTLTSSDFDTTDEWNKLSGYSETDLTKFFICYNHPELVDKITYFISGK